MMCDASNAVAIQAEMLKYLPTAAVSLREELVLKMAVLAERHASDHICEHLVCRDSPHPTVPLRRFPSESVSSSDGPPPTACHLVFPGRRFPSESVPIRRSPSDRLPSGVPRPT
eukprot:1179413-Prorocentrum_minimum.AAC.1